MIRFVVNIVSVVITVALIVIRDLHIQLDKHTFLVLPPPPLSRLPLAHLGGGGHRSHLAHRCQGYLLLLLLEKQHTLMEIAEKLGAVAPLLYLRNSVIVRQVQRHIPILKEDLRALGTEVYLNIRSTVPYLTTPTLPPRQTLTAGAALSNHPRKHLLEIVVVLAIGLLALVYYLVDFGGGGGVGVEVWIALLYLKKQSLQVLNFNDRKAVFVNELLEVELVVDGFVVGGGGGRRTGGWGDAWCVVWEGGGCAVWEGDGCAVWDGVGCNMWCDSNPIKL